MIKFYKCLICGNIFQVVNDSHNKPYCCSKTMELLIPGDSDGALESHVPIFTISGRLITIDVGQKFHPMSAEHRIEWIGLETTKGYHHIYLNTENKPQVCFKLSEQEEPIAIYAYCNLHGLWTSITE